MEAQKKNQSRLEDWMQSFNRVSLLAGKEMDSWMADVSAEVLLMSDVICGKKRSFFDKGMILLSECNEAMRDNIKACMFWWVFNEEILENAVKELIHESRKRQR